MPIYHIPYVSVFVSAPFIFFYSVSRRLVCGICGTSILRTYCDGRFIETYSRDLNVNIKRSVLSRIRTRGTLILSHFAFFREGSLRRLNSNALGFTFYVRFWSISCFTFFSRQFYAYLIPRIYCWETSHEQSLNRRENRRPMAFRPLGTICSSTQLHSTIQSSSSYASSSSSSSFSVPSFSVFACIIFYSLSSYTSVPRRIFDGRWILL